MTAQDKATARPWKVDDGGGVWLVGQSPNGANAALYIRDSEGEPMAVVRSPLTDVTPAIQDVRMRAALIVAAVNERSALLARVARLEAALRTMIPYALAVAEGDGGEMARRIEAEVITARAALADGKVSP